MDKSKEEKVREGKRVKYTVEKALNILVGKVHLREENTLINKKWKYYWVPYPRATANILTGLMECRKREVEKEQERVAHSL